MGQRFDMQRFLCQNKKINIRIWNIIGDNSLMFERPLLEDARLLFICYGFPSLL